jgi:hypothetical protein
MKAILAILVIVMNINVAHADFIWTEVGDAGQLPSSAQVVSGPGALTAINGTMSGPFDVDMFRIIIAAPMMFFATTTPGTLDTQLFLFDVSGLGIAANDDQNPPTTSLLPAGNSLYASLVPGEYLLAISLFDNDPQSSGGLLFPSTFAGVFGPTGPGGASPLSGWSEVGGAEPPMGSYTINFGGAAGVATVNVAVPVPPSIYLAALGMYVISRRLFDPRLPRSAASVEV